ncbi:GHKL domain-containing protein [Spongiibacter nanhainus]|uniref:histidine kinase n=1 Tax=Spongiibacter nanhainus TaxID=2794344 RepID=A0A7T4UNP9_9GAMM|nr:ATP-binding protein [Spongiibacter nanhainus]QQD16818.1 GHKL domain-containing protein [Spongiibacter nanhainus]
MSRANRPYSLSGRLLVAMLVAMPLLLAFTGIAIDRAHTSSLLKAEQDRMRLQFFGLLGAIEWRDGDLEMGERLQEPRFWQFRSGLYARITIPGGETLWQSLSSDTINLPTETTPPAAGQERFDTTVVDGTPSFRFLYHVVWEDEDGSTTPLLFSLYTDQQPLNAEQQQFRWRLVLWMSLALLLFLVISGGILIWGLRPLRQLARDLQQLEQGATETLADNYPRELRGITANLNLLLDKEQRQRERYRNTLADLAHSLKTPLAVLRGTNDSAERAEQLDRMDRIISYQLKRAVSTGQQGLRQRTALSPLFTRLCRTLDKVYRDKAPQITIDIPENLTAPIDEQDAMELFGNVLDNACKACRCTISLHAYQQDTEVVVTIDDDGDGISEEQTEQITARGKRGDQYGQGQGLGLAIVRDIVDSYKARLSFTKSPLGGCRVTVCFAKPSAGKL